MRTPKHTLGHADEIGRKVGMSDSKTDECPNMQSEILIAVILARIADGESVRSILKADGMPARSTWHEWLAKDEALQARYGVAKEIGTDNEFDEAKEVVNACKAEPGEVAKARLQLDAIKWRCGVQHPKKYRDKVDVNHGGGMTVNIAGPDADL